MRARFSRSTLAATALVALVLVSLGLLTSARPAAAAASPWNENPHSRVRLVSPYRVAPANGELWLGLHFTLAPGWHVYWKNSGDAGFPPVIDTTATPELGDVELLFPAPDRYELAGGLVAFGYAHEVVYPVHAMLAAPGEERLELSITLDYLVCEVDCVPYRYTLRLDQPLAGRAAGEAPAPEIDPETAPLLDAWRSRLPRPVAELPEITTDAVLDVSDLERPTLLVTVKGVEPEPGLEPEIFLEHHELFETGTPSRETTGDHLRFSVPLELRRRLEEAPRTTPFAWTVTNLGTPHAIEARRAVPAQIGAEIDEAEDGGARTDLVAVVLGGLAGGLLLALTPGALALLLAFLVGFRGLATPATRPALSLGATACAGAVAGSLLLALFALTSVPGRGAASVVASGAHLNEPTALAALALVSLGLVLWLWGFVGNAEARLSSRGLGTGPAAVAGALAPLLALSWPVPPASTALARAAAGGDLATVLVAAALGLGLGLPWLAGGFVVSGMAARARDGATERTRQALGFVAALTIFWLLYLLSASVRTEYLAFVELALLITALVTWLRRRSRSQTLRAVLMIALLAAAVSTVWLADRGRLRARAPAPEESPRRAQSPDAEADRIGPPADVG